MGELPAGTVTFLFTDIEGSTKLVQRLGRAFKDLLEEHQRLIREAVERHGGVEIRSMGDGLFVAFARASSAVAAAVEAQRALNAHRWPEDSPIRVRMGLHTGDAIVAAGDYVGLAVHEAARVSAAGHGGQILITEATRALLVDGVPAGASLADLGMHRLKDLLEPIRLYQVDHPELPSGFAPLKSLSVQPNNLPLHLTSFIGRDAEVSELAKVIPTVRLLTLVGMGGTGKTRLALEAAGDLLASFGEGVWFVDLAPVTDPAAVPHAVLAALGAREEPDRDPLDTAAERIGDGSMLLILDNCEHLIDRCAAVADRLLRACGALRILATSREPLGVDGETIRRIPPLGLPPDDDTEAALASDSVRLFVARALSAGQPFALTDATVGAIARICARLDGIPLAVELAAARARVLSPEQIADRLDDVFAVLGRGARTVPERQRTLRAAIEWSDDLLDKDERRMFHRLSVFEGRFALEAAEGVCASDELPVEQVVDLLDGLVQRSLIALAPDAGGSRYRLLTVVRSFATERLHASGEQDALRDRHLAWFAARTRSLAGDLKAAALEALEADLDDMRAALRWGLEGGDRAMGLMLLRALSNFWMVRGHLREGRGWLTAYLGATLEPPAWLLRDAGDLAQRLGALDEAEALHEEAFERARAEGDAFTELSTLSSLGDAAHARGDLALAQERYEAALNRARDAQDGTAVAPLLGNLGHIAYGARDSVRALELYRESLQISRTLGDERAVAESLQSVGRALTALQRHDEAAAAYDEALAIARRLGHAQFVAVVTSSRANLAFARGDVGGAIAGHEEALAVRAELGDVFGEAVSSYHLAEALAQDGRHARARDLLDQSLQTFRSVGASLPIGACLTLLGSVEDALGASAAARARFTEALATLTPLGDPLALCGCLEALAESLVRTGDAANAGLALGAAARLRREHEMPPDVLPAERIARALEQVRAYPDGDAAFARAQTIPVEQVVATVCAACAG